MSAINELRLLHRPGSHDLGTAIAFARAGAHADWVALLDLARTIDGTEDDLLGVAIWLALIGGHTLSAHRTALDADLMLDAMAAAERRSWE